MGWTLLLALVLALGLALLAALARRRELAQLRATLGERERAERHGSARAALRHPVVDLSRCLGCGTCVAACPEEGVLALVHGQAAVVHGARCVGHAACERECPVGAITVTQGDLSQRRDVPVIDARLEAVGTPGLFLAGEVTAHALIHTAVAHGTAVAAEVGRRAQAGRACASEGALDLVIVGAGPAGLACSLEAKRLGLSFVTLDQADGPGGTVATYPRRKLVVSQPLELPLYGPLPRASYTKEELVGLWREIAADQALPIHGGEVFEGLERTEGETFRVRTQAGTYEARHVCLALGRRGTPRKLGVPGEELPKVAYSLLDASSYQGRRVLVVGGGDGAVETALGLAEQPGNEVLIAYRGEGFFRIRQRSAERLERYLAAGKLRVLFSSRVVAIGAEHVELAYATPEGEVTTRIPNDDVFVMAGGVAPFELLGRSGVSFDPALRPATRLPGEQGTGLVTALAAALVLALACLAFALWHADYYLLPAEARPEHAKHAWLRPGRALGLGFGLAALGLVGVNLLYLLRRAQRPRFPVWRLGSLKAWMTSHIATGVLAFLCAALHAGLAPRDTVGGHGLGALFVLIASGAVGRYFYAYVPRAANGRELALNEVKAELARLDASFAGEQAGFRTSARGAVLGLAERGQWGASFTTRLLALAGVQRELRRALARIAADGARLGVAPERVRATLRLARHAHRTALMAAHYEDLRCLAASWRWLHRWVAALMLLLVALHVLYALAYGAHAPFAGLGGER
jgi:thioredoxin reductase